MESKSSNLILYILGLFFITLIAIAIVHFKPLIVQTETAKISGVVDRIGPKGNDYLEIVFLLKDNNTLFTIDSSAKVALTKSGDTVEFTIQTKDKLVEAEEYINWESFVNLTLKEERKIK